MREAQRTSPLARVSRYGSHFSTTILVEMDETDIASIREQWAAEVAILNIMRTPIAEGTVGECEWCGYHSPRLVRNACAPCRDSLGLP